MIPKVVSGPKGLKIIFCKNSQNLSVSLLLLVKAGTDLEKKSKNGIFHFIEHLYFKGTKKYPNAKVLMEAIDEVGGSYNAFTGYQYTGYYIKVLPEYLFDALEILSEIIINPLFPKDEIEKERKVIFEEINLYRDIPSNFVIDLGYSLSFGDQPAGWPILGTKETVEKINRNDILKTINDNYSSRNTILIISGQIYDQKKIVNYVNRIFHQYNSKKPKLNFIFRHKGIGYEEKIYHKKVEQAHVFLGFPMPGLNDLGDKRFYLHLTSSILGDKSSSRLWLKIREEMGAAYYIRSYFNEYFNRSLFFIHAGLNLDRLENVLSVLAHEIRIFKEKGPTEKEMETAKAVLKSSLFMDLEESLGTAIFYGRQYLWKKKFLTPKEISQKIDEISPKSFRKYISNFLELKHLKFAIIIPPEIKINFSKIFRKLLK
ncbi:MAG: insulinase family protein [Patescibacteria group bacterium]|nr:insulinase family protein [Patescibacteria group bacterium]